MKCKDPFRNYAYPVHRVNAQGADEVFQAVTQVVTPNKVEHVEYRDEFEQMIHGKNTCIAAGGLYVRNHFGTGTEFQNPEAEFRAGRFELHPEYVVPPAVRLSLLDVARAIEWHGNLPNISEHVGALENDVTRRRARLAEMEREIVAEAERIAPQRAAVNAAAALARVDGKPVPEVPVDLDAAEKALAEKQQHFHDGMVETRVQFACGVLKARDEAAQLCGAIMADCDAKAAEVLERIKADLEKLAEVVGTPKPGSHALNLVNAALAGVSAPSSTYEKAASLLT